MFEDSLIESGGKFSGKRRGATTMVSFIIQIILVGILVLIPLIYTEALPKQQLMTFLVAPPPPPPPPPPPAAAPPVKVIRKIETELDNGQLRTPTKIPQKVQMIKEDEPPPPPPAAAPPVKVIRKIETELDNGQLRQPTKIPQKVQIIKEDEAPPPSMGGGGVVGGVPGGVPGGSMGGVIGGIIGATSTTAVPKVATPQRVRVSQGVSEGLLVHQVKPAYPPLARQARIQGSVVLQAAIGKDGSIQNLRLISGHPMLAPAAIEAVKLWKYRPYFLNGEPVEVDTQITVNFTLSSGG